MKKEHFEMILTSQYINENFKNEHLGLKNIPHRRPIEYIIANGVDAYNEKNFISFVSDVIGIKAVELTDKNPDESLKVSFPFKIAYAYKVAPLLLKEDILEIACIDPLEKEIIEDIEILTGYSLKCYLCGKYSLDSFLERFYRKNWVHAPIKDIDEDIDFFQDEPDVFKIFIDILNDALKQGVEKIFIQHSKESLTVEYYIDGVSKRAYVPPLFEKKYDKFCFLLNLKGEHLREVKEDIIYHFFIDDKYEAFRIFLTPTNKGSIIRVDIPANQVKNIPDLDLDYFSAEERRCLDEYQKKSPGILFITFKEDENYAFYHAVCEKLGKNVNRGVLVEDYMVKPSHNLSHILSKDINCNKEFRLIDYFSKLSPDLICVRSEKLISFVNDFIHISYTLGIPVICSLPFNEIKEAITFLSQKMDKENRFFLSLQNIVGLMALKSYRHVCPVCSVDVQINPKNIELLKNIDDDIITVKEARACSVCNDRGYMGRDFLTDTVFLNETGHLKDVEYSKAFMDYGIKTDYYEKAVKKIIKRQTTIKEIERILS